MKHFLLMTYNLYFIFLMIVPCNHNLLYVNTTDNSASHQCSHHHEHEHSDPKQHDDSSNHHHSCTPYCACGIAHFVLQAPPLAFTVHQSYYHLYPFGFEEAKVWATVSNGFLSQSIDEIWNPPRLS